MQKPEPQAVEEVVPQASSVTMVCAHVFLNMC
jgi:hypothetical protein